MVGGRRTKPRVTEKVRRRLLALANRLVFAMPRCPRPGCHPPQIARPHQGGVAPPSVLYEMVTAKDRRSAAGMELLR